MASKVGTVVSSEQVDQRLEIPAVELSVPLDLLESKDGFVLPPSADRAYRLHDRGAAQGAEPRGTTYVAMHSVVGGMGPGNYLFDRDGRTVLQPGDDIHVGQVRFTVSSVKHVDKTALTYDAVIWDELKPGRLILLTCLIQRDGSIDENLVVEATIS